MRITIGISVAILVVGTFSIHKWASVSRRPLPSVASVEGDYLQKIFGNDIERELVKNPFPYMKIRSETNQIIGYIYCSEDLGTINHGYKSEVKLIIATDQYNKILKVLLHESKESPEQVAKILKNGMIDKWRGRGFSDSSPDTVTGATKTSLAINKTVRDSLEKINAL